MAAFEKLTEEVAFHPLLLTLHTQYHSCTLFLLHAYPFIPLPHHPLLIQVNTFLHEQDGPAHPPMTPHNIAMGFLKVANEAMCRPIRALTQVTWHVHELLVYWYMYLTGAIIKCHLLCMLTCRERVMTPRSTFWPALVVQADSMLVLLPEALACPLCSYTGKLIMWSLCFSVRVLSRIEGCFQGTCRTY